MYSDNIDLFNDHSNEYKYNEEKINCKSSPKFIFKYVYYLLHLFT